MWERIPVKGLRWRSFGGWASLVVLGFAGAWLLIAMNAWRQGQDQKRDQDRAPVAHGPSAPIALGGSQMVVRGEYLARIGNCASCHTARGGEPFAGGKGLETPFGTIFASNITPAIQSGIGTWTTADFWQAMHHGRSKDGRLLYPAFPYSEYTRITRDDSDALFAYLLSLQPVERENRSHALRFPYNTQAALAVWRTLFFSPAAFEPQAEQTAQWNRGAYLVRGLGHCQACHSPRNVFGATPTRFDLSGGVIPMQNWYAPSLSAPTEAGLQDWSVDAIMQWLQTGKTVQGSALGPMAEVVFSGTQYLSNEDSRAIAVFLKSLPRREAIQPDVAPGRVGAQQDQTLGTAGAQQLGQRVYEKQCADCHGDNGTGQGDYPSLVGNRTVTLPSSVNLVHVILSGGFPPTTSGNPRPHGMPPFRQTLSDAEVAAVASYVRSAWGNRAGAVMPLDVNKTR